MEFERINQLREFIENGDNAEANNLFAKIMLPFNETGEITEEIEECRDKFFICPNCENVAKLDDSYDVEGVAVCEHCVNYSGNIVSCKECGDLLWEDNSTYVAGGGCVCDCCKATYYDYCYRCEEWYRSSIGGSDVYYDYDSHENWCEYCVEDYAHWCDYCDIYYSTDYCPCCDEDEDNGSINPYSFKPSPYFYGSDSNLFMGVELEIDGGSSPNSCAKEITNVGCGHVYCKHDGSLNDGIEIVTHPATLDYHRNNFPWEDIVKAAQNFGFKSHNTSTCGLHVHVSRNFFGDTEEEQDLAISKLMLIVNRFWRGYIVPFTRRKEENLDQWARKNCSLDDCTTKETKESLLKKCKDSKGDRYQAVNINNYNTVEFRIFRGTLKLNTLIATLEWVDSVCRVAKEIKLRDIPKMTWEDTMPVCVPKELSEYLEEIKDRFMPDSIINPIRPSTGDEEMPKYKVGDSVYVLAWNTMLKAEENEYYAPKGILTFGTIFLNEMKKYCNRKFKVKEVVPLGYILEDPDDAEIGEYVFSPAQLRKPRTKKVDPNFITLDI